MFSFLLLLGIRCNRIRCIEKSHLSSRALQLGVHQGHNFLPALLGYWQCPLCLIVCNRYYYKDLHTIPRHYLPYRTSHSHWVQMILHELHHKNYRCCHFCLENYPANNYIWQHQNLHCYCPRCKYYFLPHPLLHIPIQLR